MSSASAKVTTKRSKNGKTENDERLCFISCLASSLICHAQGIALFVLTDSKISIWSYLLQGHGKHLYKQIMVVMTVYKILLAT